MRAPLAMPNIMDYPILILALSLFLLWLSMRIGIFFRDRLRISLDDSHEDLTLIISAALTLLGLLIGFSFSMAITRYDLRKNYEEAEANAIGTEYLRADLLPAAAAPRVRLLLRKYLDQRVLFYRTRGESQLRQVNADTARLQSELWAAVSLSAAAVPTTGVTLAVSGMNDVLNSQGYTQAAWWNRIPIAAWGLMVAIAICCHILVGASMHGSHNQTALLLILPLIISISFFLIAEIDSPAGGIIRVTPQNLVSLSQSLQSN
jgi:hypothetical protein